MDFTELVLDTDVVINHLRRRSNVLLNVTQRFECAITAVTYYELLAVPTLSNQQAHLLKNLTIAMPILPLEQASADKAAEIWRTLRFQGLSIGIPDTFIAGICIAHRLPLLTLNQRHYGRIQALTLVSPHDFTNPF